MAFRIQWYGKQIPVAVYKSGNLLTYKNGQLNILDCGRVISTTPVPYNNCIDRIKEKIRFLSRLFRKDIRCTCITDTDEVYFFKDKKLFKYDDSGKLSTLYTVPEGRSTPLNILPAEKESGYVVFWGEYFSNDARTEVNIIGITADGIAKNIYKFPPGSIRHIHNIVKDKYMGGYYIFTGDNDVKAGIYYADINFDGVYPIYTGNQKCRAVQGFPTEDGIIYATDSVNDLNYICELKRSNGKWQFKEICKMNGSCIYAARLKNLMIFATTVEPKEAENSNKLLNLFSTQRGEGILSDEVKVVALNQDYQSNTVLTLKKDKMPYKLFQYGTVYFAACHESSENIVFYAVAVKERDGNMGVITLNSGRKGCGE